MVHCTAAGDVPEVVREIASVTAPPAIALPVPAATVTCAVAWLALAKSKHARPAILKDFEREKSERHRKVRTNSPYLGEQIPEAHKSSSFVRTHLGREWRCGALPRAQDDGSSWREFRNTSS